MTDLTIKYCDVVLNKGVNEELESELQSVFMDSTCSLHFSYDIQEQVSLNINVNYKTKSPFYGDENLLLISIDEYAKVDALRRYCEMVLDHLKRSEEIHGKLSN